jgi:hypothetical protein
METVVSEKVGDILDKSVSKVETACRICSVSLTDYFDRIREIVGAIGEKMICPPRTRFWSEWENLGMPA